MATSFVILCPECEKQIKVTEEVIGKKIRCKECEYTFVVKQPKESPKPAKPKASKSAEPEEDDDGATFKLKDEPKAEKPAAKKKPAVDDDDEENADPYALAKTLDHIPRCPFCTAELETADVKVCKDCGYDMVTRRRHETAMVHDHTGQEKFNWRLPGYLCVAGILILITVSIICMVKTRGWLDDSWFQDEEDKTKYILKPGCFMLGNGMMVAFVCFHLGKFAFKRLVTNNLPPAHKIEEGDAEEADAMLEDDDDD